MHEVDHHRPQRESTGLQGVGQVGGFVDGLGTRAGNEHECSRIGAQQDGGLGCTLTDAGLHARQRAEELDDVFHHLRPGQLAHHP